MASEQWLFNDTSVASGANFAKVGSSVYNILQSAPTAISRTTTSPTPYEGAGSYQNGTVGDVHFFVRNGSSDTSEPLYFDGYLYIKSSAWSGQATPILMGDFAYFQAFTWARVLSGSIEYGSYDSISGTAYSYNTTTFTVPTDAWFRWRAKTGYNGIEQFAVFTGTNINGSSPSQSLPTINFSSLAPPTATYLNEEVNAGCLWIDDLKLDTAAYPTRAVAKLSVDMLTL